MKVLVKRQNFLNFPISLFVKQILVVTAGVTDDNTDINHLFVFFRLSSKNAMTKFNS